MPEKCPVCKNNIKATDKACSVCGFADLHREFITKEDGELWTKSVVEPYRKKWNLDEPEEIRELRRKANSGDAIAQNNLGVCYFDGSGVKQDFEMALYWFRESAEQGNATAQYHIGLAYDRGSGVQKDERKAAYWYAKAAEQGEKSAQNNLGMCYRKGIGVAKDINRAIHYYEQAIENGSAAAAYNLAAVYDSTIPEYPNDFSKAFKYYKLAKERGYSSGQLFNNLGVLYADGKGVEKNYEMAKEYYEKAISMGETSAKDNLGRLLMIQLEIDANRSELQNENLFKTNSEDKKKNIEPYIIWLIVCFLSIFTAMFVAGTLGEAGAPIGIICFIVFIISVFGAVITSNKL